MTGNELKVLTISKEGIALQSYDYPKPKEGEADINLISPLLMACDQFKKEIGFKFDDITFGNEKELKNLLLIDLQDNKIAIIINSLITKQEKEEIIKQIKEIIQQKIIKNKDYNKFINEGGLQNYQELLDEINTEINKIAKKIKGDIFQLKFIPTDQLQTTIKKLGNEKKKIESTLRIALPVLLSQVEIQEDLEKIIDGLVTAIIINIKTALSNEDKELLKLLIKMPNDAKKELTKLLGSLDMNDSKAVMLLMIKIARTYVIGSFSKKAESIINKEIQSINITELNDFNEIQKTFLSTIRKIENKLEELFQLMNGLFEAISGFANIWIENSTVYLFQMQTNNFLAFKA